MIENSAPVIDFNNIYERSAGIKRYKEVKKRKLAELEAINGKS